MSIIDISKQENTIFIPMKVFVSVNPRGVGGPEFLIAYGQTFILLFISIETFHYH